MPQEDPFTRFLDPDQLAALQGATSGNLIGVGLEISPGPAAKDGSSTLVRAHTRTRAHTHTRIRLARGAEIGWCLPDARVHLLAPYALHACVVFRSWLWRLRQAGPRSAQGCAPATSC